MLLPLPNPAVQGHEPQDAHGSGGHGGEDPFQTLFAHVVPQDARTLAGLQLYDIQVFQVVAIGLTAVLMLGVPRAVRARSGGFLARSMAGTVAWVRDAIVYPNLGKTAGRRFVPFFCSLFFFIVLMNLLGLVPGGRAATASAYVTGSLACVTLGLMLIGGMIVQGPVAFWRNLVPPGVPKALVPLLFFLELIGLLVKPFALTMRLMGNMTGGHLALLAFLGLLFLFGSQDFTTGVVVSPLVVGLSVFMTLIEGFVALLQAYVFTALSAIFVGMCLHPHH